MNLEENLKMTIPEIEPLQSKEKSDYGHVVVEIPARQKVPLKQIKTQVSARIRIINFDIKFKNYLISDQGLNYGTLY